VLAGRLAAGVRLPSTRSLAADLGIARGTVVQAYSQLVAEGWLVGVAGSGTRVAGPFTGRVESGTPPTAAASLSAGLDLRPGRPDISSFPRAAWAAAVRRAAMDADVTALDYGDPAGAPVARAVIADYAGRTRGVLADADSVVITAGFTQGLALLARTLRRLGVRQVATENPGHGRHRQVVRAAGLDTIPLPIDPAGADPTALTADVGAALLTPAHQYPWGVVLAPLRRTGFVEWARRGGGYLIEDDYDAEFRYGRQPVGAMQPLARDRIVFAGSTSKTLAPGIRLGWLIVPPSLRAPLLDTIRETGAAVPVLDQLALADLIARGDYDRHIRRVRLGYRRRRIELAQRLATVTATPLEGITAGLHALLPVESAERERRLIANGKRGGLLLHGLHTDGYWHHRDDDQAAALVLGYATPPQHTWRHSLNRLTDLIGPPT
jgi:GntR family transcriptional regulator / MocR family aminotransferase